MTSPAGPDPAPAASLSRLGAIDLFRGFAIIEVVFHHVTSYAMRHVDTTEQGMLLLQAANRTMHFAVPSFLFMTALVFTRSALAKPFSPARFYLSRVTKTLVPYAIWTALYALFVVATTPRTFDTLFNAEPWLRWLRTGKAYYHLYFLVVAIQFYALFPWLVALYRRRPRVLDVVLVAALLQLALYWGNRLIWRSPSPGSLVLWYVPALAVGMLAGSRFDEFPAFWRRWRWWIALIAVASWAWYLPISVAALRGERVDTFAYQVSFWCFTTAVSIILFGVCLSLSGRRGLGPIRLLGAHSLQVYLIHPAVIAYLDNVRDFPNLESFLGYATLYFLTLGVPLVVSMLVRGSPLSRLLFGR